MKKLHLVYRQKYDLKIICNKRFMKIITLFLTFLYCYNANSLTIKEAMSEAYDSSPEILALRSKLKASNEDIAKAIGQKRPKINLEARSGYDRTDTISTSSIEKTQYNSPRSLTLDITQNIFDSGKTSFNIRN